MDVPLDFPEADPDTIADTDRELNVQLHIVNALKPKGFRVASQIQWERDRKAWENGNLDTEPDPIDILWIVKHDDTIQFPTAQVDTYKWYKVEICTPALAFSPWNLRHVWEFLRIITRRYRLNCNQSCALHIHVSTAKKEFTLDILKNLMGMIFTFERQLEQCHPSYRIHNNSSTFSLRDHVNINQNFKPGKSFSCSDRNWKEEWMLDRQQKGLPQKLPPARSERDFLAAIFSATSKAELVKMFKSDEDFRLGYNIGFLDEPYPDSFKRTIEFRQHRSTTKPEVIERWLNICCRLVDVARQTAGASNGEKKVFRRFLLDHIGGSADDFGLVMLLVNLGLIKEAGHCSMEMANRPDVRPPRRSMQGSDS
ncbi:hypothetical protein DID88_002370 [Monilinia fructigena]|nr:hypothetical protein DID88_002370 [Monilinia fructigena]